MSKSKPPMCPLLNAGIVLNKDVDTDWVPCLQQECMWWDHEDDVCLFRTLVLAMVRLTNWPKADRPHIREAT